MMKITAGMASIDDYIPFVKAGVDELFIGYVPDYFLDSFQMLPALNRREVLYANVNIGSYMDLKILAKMVEQYQVPITITLNSLYYHPKQYPVIQKVMMECLAIGFDCFIIADMALLLYLEKQHLLEKIHVHISGEFGEINHFSLDLLKQLKMERLIFHRQVSLENMQQLIVPEMTYEAFILNERCQYHGGYCQSFHCDELRHLCLMTYMHPLKDEKESKDVLGQSGCGLCALYKLNQMGVQYLKLVSRGNYQEATVADIKALKEAIALVEIAKDENTFIYLLKKKFFLKGCSGNCYYREYEND